MPATRKSDKAIRLAVQALRNERQKLAYDANLFDLRLACYPQAKAASERRKEIDAAIAELSGQPEPSPGIAARLAGKSEKRANQNSEQMEMFFRE
jgi:hypothetical protein